MSSPPKSRRLQRLGFRLTVWYAIVLCAAVLGTGTFLYYRLNSHLHKQSDQFLDLLSRDFTSLIAANLNDIDKIRKELNRETMVGGRRPRLTYCLLAPDGRVVAESKHHPEFRYELGPVLAAAQRADGPVDPRTVYGESRYPYRITAQAVRSAGKVAYVVESGYYLKQMEKVLQNYRRNFLRVLVPFVFVGIAGGWWLARKSLSPIADMTATAQTISRESLKNRIPVKGTSDELDRLAEVLNEMLDRLQESFERIEQFSSDLAHEFRTPLTVLKGEAESALTGKRSADELRTIIAEQAEAYDHLSRMITDLLLLSRKEAGTAKTKFGAVDVGTCVRQVADAFDPLAKEAGIELRVSCPDTPCQVRGDESALGRLFSNLVENAIKHTPARGEVTIDVQAGETCTVRVNDTGIGIPPEDLPHIFDRFYRADRSRSRDTGGFGLGLSICKQIAETHRVSIHISSEVGRGTEVTVKLPFASTPDLPA